MVAAVRQPLPLPPPFAAPPMADRALLARFDPFFPDLAVSGESLPVTSLPISLHGVRADSSTGRGSAIIASGDGVQQVYTVGDLISDGVSLAAIARDHVLLDRGGVRETLWLDSAGANAVQRFDIAAPEPPEPITGDQNVGTPDPAVPQPAIAPTEEAAVMPAVPADPQ